MRNADAAIVLTPPPPPLRVQVGSDDDGYAVRLKLKHFLAYCSHLEHAPADDSPLYVFAHLDRDREEGRALLQDYAGGSLGEGLRHWWSAAAVAMQC